MGVFFSLKLFILRLQRAARYVRHATVGACRRTIDNIFRDWKRSYLATGRPRYIPQMVRSFLNTVSMVIRLNMYSRAHAGTSI